MSGRNNDNGFTYEQDESMNESTGRHIPRRRPQDDEPARQERRRWAAMELEQVEKTYLEKSGASEVTPAYPSYGELRPSEPAQERYAPAAIHDEPVPGRPVSPLYSDPGYKPPHQSAPAEPVVPAYPAPKRKAPSGRFQDISRAQKPFSDEPAPEYTVTEQENEVLIDASEVLYDPEEPQAILPMDNEYGGRSEILNDEDDSSDEAATLAKGGRLQTRISTKRRRKKRVGKRRYGVFLGSVVLLFALLGVVVAVYSVTDLIIRVATDGSALRAYDEMIAPVVGLDPEPFENIKGADPDMVLMSSILAVEYASTDANEYSDFVNNVQNIPVSEILVQATNLFGPDCNVRLQSIEDDINSYVYDEAKEVIVAPMYSNIGAYIGRTVSKRRSGDSVLLRVAYISSANWGEAAPDGTEQEVDENELVVDKYMEYELKTDPETGRQYVFAIRALEDGSSQQANSELS